MNCEELSRFNAIDRLESTGSNNYNEWTYCMQVM